MSADTIAEVQKILGEGSKFQLRTGLLAVIPSVFCAMGSYSYVFLAAVPQHRCFVSGCDVLPPDRVDFRAPWVTRAIPMVNDEGNVSDPANWDPCRMFIPSGVSVGASGDGCDVQFDSSELVECSQWVYDRSTFASTVVTEWDLVCSRGAALNPLSQTLFFAGTYLGGVVFGTLSDLIGRRPNFAAAVFCMGLLGSATAASPNYITYVTLRFLVAAASQGVYMTSFVLGLEHVGQSKRSAFGAVISYFWAIGGILLVGLAWVTRRWRWLLVLTSAPMLLCLLYIPWLPESIDWLVSRGKYIRASQIIERVERVNERTVPDELKEALKSQEGRETDENGVKERKGFVPLFKELLGSRILIVRALVTMYLWIAADFVFYGLSLNASLIGGDLFVDFLALAVAEIPAYTAAWILMDCWGRKYGTALSLAFGGIATVLAAATGSLDLHWLNVLLSSIGKAGGTSAYTIIYVYTAELFPTPLRSVTMSIASLFAKIGSMASPFMGLLATVWAPLPMYCFGVLSLLGSILTLLLVETRGLPLPQTVEEAEKLGKRHAEVEPSDESSQADTRKSSSKASSVIEEAQGRAGSEEKEHLNL